ncbi:MAG: hypothetical protein ACODAJ_06960, partial [Planctomycetota bacterium]
DLAADLATALTAPLAPTLSSALPPSLTAALPPALAASLTAALPPALAASLTTTLSAGLLHILGDPPGVVGDTVLALGHSLAHVGREIGDAAAFALQLIEGLLHAVDRVALVALSGAAETADEILLSGALATNGARQLTLPRLLAAALSTCLAATLTAALPSTLTATLSLSLAAALGLALPTLSATLAAALTALRRTTFTLSLAAFAALSGSLGFLVTTLRRALAADGVGEALGALTHVGLLARDSAEAAQALACRVGSGLGDILLVLDEPLELADLRVELAEGLVAVGDLVGLILLGLLLVLELPDLVLPLLELSDASAQLVVIIGGEGLDEADQVVDDLLLLGAGGIELPLVEQVGDGGHAAFDEPLLGFAEGAQESLGLLGLGGLEDFGEATELLVELLHHLPHAVLAHAQWRLLGALSNGFAGERRGERGEQDEPWHGAANACHPRAPCGTG